MACFLEKKVIYIFPGHHCNLTSIMKQFIQTNSRYVFYSLITRLKFGSPDTVQQHHLVGQNDFAKPIKRDNTILGTKFQEFLNEFSITHVCCASI